MRLLADCIAIFPALWLRAADEEEALELCFGASPTEQQLELRADVSKDDLDVDQIHLTTTNAGR